MNPRPYALEWYDGAWHPEATADGPEPEAVVLSPTEFQQKWCWWARGEMGDAETRAAACEAAESSLRRGER